MKNKFYKILLIVYSVLSIGSTIYLLCQPQGNYNKERYGQTEKELKEIRDYLRAKDAGFQRTIDSLNHKADSLQSLINESDKKLTKSRQHVSVLSNQLNHYIDSYAKDTSLVKNDIAFDSLSSLSTEYVIASQVRDSLCDSQISLLTASLAIKDSAIKNNNLLIGDYKSSVEQLLQTSTDLNEKLKDSEKKLRRKARINKVVSVAAVFLSGFIIASYTH